MPYTMDTRLSGEFERIVRQIEEALSAEGFGVLCDIDVQSAFAEKLDTGEEFRRYRILGACNRAPAHEALGEKLELGALLPCNVVYETDDGTVGVSAISPEVDVVGDTDLDPVASDVRERLERVLSSLPDDSGT